MPPGRIVATALALTLLAACGATANHGGSTASGTSKGTTAGGTKSKSGTGPSASSAKVSGCVQGAAAKGATLTAPEEPDQGVISPTAACWAHISPTPIAVVDTGSTPKGDSAQFWVAWSPKYLFVRAYAATWPLEDAANDAAGDWWESDATEFGVSGLDTHAGSYCTVSATDPTYQLAITTKGVLERSGCNGVSALPPPSGLEHTVQGKGFYTELIVPWATLHVTTPAAGQKYEFDIGQDFGSSTGSRLVQLVWQADAALASGSGDWHANTQHWGTVVLG